MLDKKDIFKFVPLQSEKAKQIISCFEENNKISDTIILIQDNKLFVKSDAVLYIAKLLGYTWKFFYFLKFVPKFIRDWIYELIAKNRYQWFGKKSACMIPTNDIKSKFLDDKI